MRQDVLPLGGGIPVAMLTTEIADLTGKRHDNVMRDTRKMLVELHGEEDLLKFEEVSRDGYGRQRPCYLLPKRETMVLVTGYSIPMRAAVIDRLEQLETERRDVALAAPAPQPASDRIGQFVEAIKAPLAKAVSGGVNGYIKRAVVSPLNTLSCKLGEMRDYLDDRFHASAQRDQRQIREIEAVAEVAAITREDVREIKRFITRRVPAAADASAAETEFVTIHEAQDIVGVPTGSRSRGLGNALSASARAWFERNGRAVRSIQASSGSARFIFDRSGVEAWWEAEGIEVCNRVVAQRNG